MACPAQGGGVPDTMESARRWIGFVCPDCRFVFRVPRDHDGTGIVCPSCRRMLRIPGPGDQPPPLVIPLKGLAGEDDGGGGHDRRRKEKHRRKKSRKGEGHAWDKRSGGGQRVSHREEKRQMFWMLIGGGTLFALMVAGVWVAMFGGEDPLPRDVPGGADNVATPNDVPAAPGDGVIGDDLFLSSAEPLARRFLTVRKVEDLLPLVRQPDRAEARIRSHYPDGVVEMPGLAEFNTQRQVHRNGPLVTVGVRTGDFEEREMTFIEESGELRIDWESWVGWSEMTWEEFGDTKPEEPKLFRVILSAIDYYNFGFSDEGKWQSFRLESPDLSHAIYGYAERGSVLEARLRPPADQRKVPLVLKLAFPKNARSDSQVLIDKFIAEGWVLTDEDH